MAKEKYCFVTFTERNQDKSHVLWRHDCDMSMYRLLKLAKIEYEAGVSSTYFILLYSSFYNIFEKEISDVIENICNLNDYLGLHFDQVFWDLKDNQDFEDKIRFEKNTSETISDKEVESLSFHNPGFNTSINIQKNSYSGLVNAYAPIYNEYKYVSDLNGYWWLDQLEEVSSRAVITKLQVLRYLKWWCPTALYPKECLLRTAHGEQKASCKNMMIFIKPQDV